MDVSYRLVIVITLPHHPYRSVISEHRDVLSLALSTMQQVFHTVACTDFLKGKGENKGTLACVLAQKRAF